MNGEYVDFATLLQKRETLDPDQVESGVALSVNQDGSIVWKRNKPKTQIVSINTWTSAFLVYSSIYLQRHPSRVQELLKYADIVRTAASRFGGWGWRSYDQQFRMRQQSQPSRSWSIIDGELWALYVVTSTNKTTSDHPFRPRGVNTGGFRQQFQRSVASNKGGFKKATTDHFCFDFNKHSCARKNCRYLHKCSKCKQSGHGAFKCIKKGKEAV